MDLKVVEKAPCQDRRWKIWEEKWGKFAADEGRAAKNTFKCLESSKSLLPYRRPNRCKSDHKLNTLRALFKGVNMLIWHRPGKHHGVAVAQFAWVDPPEWAAK